MGCSLIINAAKMEAAHVPSGMASETIKTKGEDINELILQPLEEHQTAENKINADLSLSTQGRMDKLRKVGTEKTTLALNSMWKTIKERQEKDQRYRTQFFTVTSGIDNGVERALMYHYLWVKLDPLDQAARVTAFIEASKRDDLRVMAAMLENPFGPMINEEVKERALAERAKRLTPNDYHNFEQNQILLEFLITFRDWIARWLVEEVGVQPSVVRTHMGAEVADVPELAGASK